MQRLGTLQVSRRDDAFATLAMLGCLVAAVLGSIYWLARLGFANPIAPILKAVALSWFVTTAPYALRVVLRLNQREYRWPISYSFLWLATLLLTAVLGWIAPFTGVNPFYAVAAAGTTGFVLAARRSFQAWRLREIFLFVIGAGFFGQWAAGVGWGRIYKNPLFFENLAATGIVHHDSLFLVALGNMLRTYGVASTGLNGLPYIPYHWGSPWLFAQWSNLLDSSLLDFYQLAHPVMMVPLFFGGAIALGVEIASRDRGPAAARPLRGLWFWGIFLAATIGVIPIQAMDALGVYTSNLIISESYAVAVPIGLMLAGASVVFWRGSAKESGAPGDLSPADKLFLLAVLPLGMVVLGFIKLSLMILGFVLAIYLALRARMHTRPVGIAAILVTTLLVFITYPAVSLPAHKEGLAPLDFLRDYVPRMWWAFFPVLHLFWSWLYVILRLIEERVATIADLRARLAARRLLDVEAVLIVALVGVAPGFITRIDGGSAFYFSDVQRWLSLGLLLALTPRTFLAFRRNASFDSRPATDELQPSSGSHARRSIRVASVAAVFFSLPLLLTLVSNSIYWTKRSARENAATRAAVYPRALAATIAPGIHGLPRLGNSTLLRRGLESSPNFPVVDQLRGLSSMSRADRRRTALLIPQSEWRYWTVLKRPGACSYSSFVAPALSGIAMIDGMPPFGCELSRFYGLGEYTPRNRPQASEDVSTANVCRKANAAGFDRVMRLSFDSAGAMTSTVVQCAR